MDFLSSQQVSENVLGSIQFDLFISLAAYEKRCVYLTENYKINAEKKIFLSFPGNPVLKYFSKTNRIFETHGFEPLNISSESGKELFRYLKTFFRKTSKDQIKIVVDYSCITKKLLANIIQVIQEIDRKNLVLNLYFIYTPVSYPQPYRLPAKRLINLDYKKDMFFNNKPLALVMGLGTVPGSAPFTIDTLKPDIVHLFYSDPALNNDFVQRVFKVNDEVISSVHPRNLISYPVRDPELLHQSLTEKCVELRLTHNVVIVPVGPKIFMLNAYLIASRYPDIQICNMSLKNRWLLFSKKPAREILIQKATFINEDY